MELSRTQDSKQALRVDESCAGHGELELSLGHAACQAVVYMSRKLRGELPRDHSEQETREYQRAEESQRSPQQRKDGQREAKGKQAGSPRTSGTSTGQS